MRVACRSDVEWCVRGMYKTWEKKKAGRQQESGPVPCWWRHSQLITVRQPVYVYTSGSCHIPKCILASGRRLIYLPRRVLRYVYQKKVGKKCRWEGFIFFLLLISLHPTTWYVHSKAISSCCSAQMQNEDVVRMDDCNLSTFPFRRRLTVCWCYARFTFNGLVLVNLVCYWSVSFI